MGCIAATQTDAGTTQFVAAVHFDTNHFNHITWTTVEELTTKLRRRIEATIPWAPKA